jgi:hypothetical protein
MTDYTYPSVFFAYLFFALMFLLAVFFFVKSLRDGYWGEKGEEAKYRMLQDDDETMKRRNP